MLPVYNEGKSIGALLEKINNCKNEINEDLKILIVDDGSEDNSLSEVNKYVSKMDIEVIRHRINMGLGITIRDGFQKAAKICAPGDIIVRMDADNTQDPKLIKQMVEKIKDGFDVVITSRYKRGSVQTGITLYRRSLSRCANILLKLFFPIKNIWDYTCGFRAYKASAIQKALHIFKDNFIELKKMGFICTPEKLIKLRMLNARMIEIPFALRYDLKKGSSKMKKLMTISGYVLLIIKNFKRPRKLNKQKK